jgi:MFS family permease
MESRAYSFNTSFLSVGNLLGPLVGGLLFGLIGFRGVFAVGSVLLLMNVGWVYMTLYLKANNEVKRDLDP